MSYQIQVLNSEAPKLRFVINLPDKKIEEIRENDSSAISLARAIISEYQEVGENKYYKILDGHKFYIDLDESNQAMGEIIRDLLLHGTYEPETTKLVKEIVKEGDVCVDVGASIGYFTLLLAKLGKEVYSIEPTSNQFSYLQKNIEINGYKDKVQIYGCAASDETGIVKIQGNAGSNLEVQGIALDSILFEKKVDFIKIDVDGSEPRVLKGLIKTIERNPQLKMVIEYYPEYIKNLGNDPQEMMDILDKYFDYKRIDGEFDESHYNLYCVRK